MAGTLIHENLNIFVFPECRSTLTELKISWQTLTKIDVPMRISMAIFHTMKNIQIILVKS